VKLFRALISYYLEGKQFAIEICLLADTLKLVREVETCLQESWELFKLLFLLIQLCSFYAHCGLH
jgi:hypothetical protein